MNFTPDEIKSIEASELNKILLNIDMPEKSRDIYRDYIILWRDIHVVSKKYNISPERVKVITKNIAALIGDYYKDTMQKIDFNSEEETE